MRVKIVFTGKTGKVIENPVEMGAVPRLGDFVMVLTHRRGPVEMRVEKVVWYPWTSHGLETAFVEVHVR